jgi:hypothetical protein
MGTTNGSFMIESLRRHWIAVALFSLVPISSCTLISEVDRGLIETHDRPPDASGGASGSGGSSGRGGSSGTNGSGGTGGSAGSNDAPTSNDDASDDAADDADED